MTGNLLQRSLKPKAEWIQNKRERSETATYTGIIQGIPSKRKIPAIATVKSTRRYLPSFPLILRSWNLSERSGILETISRDNTTEKIITETGDAVKDLISAESEYADERMTVTTASAAAGVGRPLNDTVCVVSVLNFASLSPAQTGKIAAAAMAGIFPDRDEETISPERRE